MTPRAIWHGHLRLALVSCPVALFNARHDRAGIRFHLINPKTGNRVKMITQDSITGQALNRSELVKGYELSKDKYVILTNEDFESVKVESSSVMTIDKFVDTGDIDPIYYNPATISHPTAKQGRMFMRCCAKRSSRAEKWRSPASSFPSASER